LVIVAGAVYRPFFTLPTAGDTDHLTDFLLVPLTDAVNCWVCRVLNETVCGEIETLTGVNDIVAVAVFVVPAALAAVAIAAAVPGEFVTMVAVSVTVLAVLIVAGAVYKPFVTVPTAGVRDQVTDLLFVP
jgi:hypothetical protein